MPPSIQNAANASVISSSSVGEEGVHPDCHPLVGRSFKSIADEPVFPLIQKVKQEVIAAIDTNLSYQQLQSPTVNFSVVRPLRLKLSSAAGTPPAALVYALLLNRQHFLAESKTDLAFAGLNATRADLCELLAIKSLSLYGTAPISLELLHILTTSFNPASGVSAEMFEDYEGLDDGGVAELIRWGKSHSSNALELGVYTSAKRFVKSPMVQQILTSIENGKVLYSPESAHALLNDSFKPRPVVEVYDWKTREHPWLDYHLLRVPRIRRRIEHLTFATILVLFMLVQFHYEVDRINFVEGAFIVFGLGFALDEAIALRENGWTAYAAGALNLLDSVFLVNFFAYLALRVRGLSTHDQEMTTASLETLALGACVLLPRLAISMLKGNVILLALTAMIREFFYFMVLVVLMASGFAVTLYSLSAAKGTHWSASRVSWLMIKIWLGSSFLGFDAASDFSDRFGPSIILVYSVLSSTLLLTMLISLLSNVFAAVQASAEAELRHQEALQIIERAKSDPINNFAPPLNLVALLVLFPLNVVLFWSPRYKHKVNVTFTKLLNAPILLFIAVLHRARRDGGYLNVAGKELKGRWDSLPRGIHLDGLGSLGLGNEGIDRLFTLDVTDKASEVPSLDEDSRPAASSAPAGSQERVPFPTADPRAAVHRSASLGPRATLHSRFNSISSPLARMFAVPEGEDGGEGANKVRATGKAPAVAPAGVSGATLEARLEAIERALGVLVGEVTKGQETEEEDKPPLVGISGEIESSYKD